VFTRQNHTLLGAIANMLNPAQPTLLSGKHPDSLCLPDRELIFHLVNTLKRKLLKPVYHLFTRSFERLPDKIVHKYLVTLITVGYSIEVESERNRC